MKEAIRRIMDYISYPALFLTMALLIVLVSNYYAQNFTNYDIGTLPDNKIFYYVTGNFNAYTESVSLNYTQAINYEHFQWNLIGIIIIIFLAYFSLLIFSILYNITDSMRKKNHKDYIKNYMAVAFFVSSITAIYIVEAIEYLQHLFGTGVSFQGISSILVILVFSLVNILLAARMVYLRIRDKGISANLPVLLGGTLTICLFALLFAAFVGGLSGFFFGIPELSTQAHSLNLIVFIAIFSTFMLFRKRIVRFQIAIQ